MRARITKTPGFLVLETGEVFGGEFHGGEPRGESRVGEVVFNTSHSGYEEMATDPSYFSQILVCTAPQQGNYGVDENFWESERIWINGFVCLELQSTTRDDSWERRLIDAGVPVLTGIDTRKLVFHLRSAGTTWGGIIPAKSEEEARDKFKVMLEKKVPQSEDWTKIVSAKESYELKGELLAGPRIGLMDFGSKRNIVRELLKVSSKVKVFPSHASAKEILAWAPDGLVLSNGPGDPESVAVGRQTVKELLGSCYIFGICMGHQVLSLALGARTYKLKFGHRGSNHPIKDEILNRVYMTSQNHGYAVDESSLPSGCMVTHVNMNDNTVSGISFPEKKCMSVQFHPESCPGPHDSKELFDYFIKQTR